MRVTFFAETEHNLKRLKLIQHRKKSLTRLFYFSFILFPKPLNFSVLCLVEWLNEIQINSLHCKIPVKLFKNTLHRTLLINRLLLINFISNCIFDK